MNKAYSFLIFQKVLGFHLHLPPEFFPFPVAKNMFHETKFPEGFSELFLSDFSFFLFQIQSFQFFCFDVEQWLVLMLWVKPDLSG